MFYSCPIEILPTGDYLSENESSEALEMPVIPRIVKHKQYHIPDGI